MATLKGTVAIAGLPPHRGVILSLCFFQVHGPEADCPYGGDPPAEACFDEVVVCEEDPRTADLSDTSRTWPFSTSHTAGYYYVQVRAVLFREQRGKMYAQAEQFFFGQRPVSVSEEGQNSIIFPVTWPTQPLEDLHYYSTVTPHPAVHEFDTMIEQLSLARTTWAHLFPGVVGFAFYVPAARLAIRAGLDSSFALFLTMLVVLIPCELALLYRARKRMASTPGAGPLFPWTLHQPLWVYVAAVPVLLAWAFFCFFVLAGREERLLSEYLFAWPPAGLFGSAVQVAPSKGALLLTWAFGLIVNGVLTPVVEELYFRGYLLPRIPLGRRWAPLLNAALFSVYHVFSPWQNLSRLLAVAPIAYVVSWRRSIAVGIVTHCLLNTIAMLLVLPSLLR